MAEKHALLWSCKAKISIVLLLFLQTVLIVMFLGPVALATYKKCVLSEL
jgi:hypothetical protein